MLGENNTADQEEQEDQQQGEHHHHHHHHHHHSSQQNQQQQQQHHKPRTTFQRDSHPDEKLIMQLKLHLDRLQRERQYKNASVAAQNALRIAHDEAARDKYRRSYKTDEEIYQEWLEQTIERHAMERLAFERDEEAPVRAAIEEEESLERQIGNYDNNLSLFTFTVARSINHYKRLDRQQEEKKAQEQSSADALKRSMKLMEESYREQIVVIEREERGSRKNIVQKFPSCQQQAVKDYRSRLDREAKEVEQWRIEAAVRKEEALNTEVDDMEKEFEKRLLKLSNKFSTE